MARKFYDTCALLNELHHAFSDGDFFISIITLNELENIKTSATKDQDTKFRARRLLRLLEENESKYTIIHFNKEIYNEQLQSFDFLPDNNDSKIIISAYLVSLENDIVFMTNDLACKQLAKAIGLNCDYVSNMESNYCGYKTITYKNDEQLSEIYINLYNPDYEWDILVNEYLIIQNEDGHIIDKYRYTPERKFEKIPYLVFDSKHFGKVKPKDGYQLLAMNCMTNNQLTVIRGAAGTGKSYLALGYLFSLLDKGEIDKIIIFCNTVATQGAAKLGYYPGDRTEKLLDAQIGNFLSSKIGDRDEVERLIKDRKLELLPMSDIRGYDTTGKHAGVYITEAQNMDIELIRLCIQRSGEDTLFILDGDTETQVDLDIYAGNNNGMRRVSEIFRGDYKYGEVTLKKIYRSHIAELAQLL